MAGKRSNPRGRTARGRKPRGRSTARKVLIAMLWLGAAGLVAGGAGLAALWPRCADSDCPSVEALRTYTPPQASQVFDRESRLVANLAPERRIVVPLRRIPANVSGAFLAVEDKRFYRHHGVDWRRAVGALARDVRAGSWRQGFSTLTMQLARNVFTEHLSRAKTLRRKLAEVVLARKIEAAFGKDEILEMYLNQIYLGQGLYGVEAAAQGYFGKPVGRLTDAEAAVLAALPRAPSYYDPRRNPDAALQRRNVVLGEMAKAGVISPEDAAAAKTQPLKLAPPPEARTRAPYFVAAVRRELRERFGNEAETRGYRVYTTLDPALQESAQAELVKQVQAVERGAYGRFRHPSCSAGRAVDAARCLQAMFVAVDPASGDVLALVGGRDYAASQFDRATQARRQAGSAFKPIVYATALAQNIPITTALLGPDAVDSLGAYRPADHVSDTADVDLRDALRLSSNRATVVLGNRVGAVSVVQTAKNLGLTTPIRPYPSTFIGAAEVVPLELVSAYSVFANGGALVKPRLITRVVDADGQVVYQAHTSRRYVLSPAVSFLTNSLMRDVVDRGTGSSVRQSLPYTVPAAGKTGTTDEGADVWFIGVTPNLVAGVWMGFDRPQAILYDATGGGLAAPVWGRVLAGYYQRHPVPAAWSPPPDVVSRKVDRKTGGLATEMCPGEDVVTEWYVAGTEPTQACPLHPESDGFGSIVGRAIDGIGGIFGLGHKKPASADKAGAQPARPQQYPSVAPPP